MKTFAQIARILVGIEFIFSGFVKVVDPYGTGLKLQEYFEVFAKDLPALSGFFELFANNSQPLSLIFCATELILGVALLVNYRMKITAWVVILMMGFFTFLTFYSAYFNRVTDCGCFGDFLKLKPWNSFLKDVISMVFITPIFIYRAYFRPVPFASISTAIATVIAFGIGIYALRYLPPVDFLAYAEGKSIPLQMQPTGIKPDIVYTFLDKEKNTEISSKEYLMDTLRYKYVASETLNQDELTPKITDYAVNDAEGNDVTSLTFEGTKVFIIVKKIEHLDEGQVEQMKQLAEGLKTSTATPMLLTSLVSEQFDGFKKQHGFSTPVYTIDEKVLKTMARTNPCVILLKDGVVIKKWGSHNIPTKEEVEKLSN